MISFVHTADIHLGLQFKGLLDPSESIERRSELWSTFQRIVEYTKKNNLDFLFIAGDLFEEEYFTLGDMKRVRDILKSAKTINIVIIAGNHDYLDERSLYNKVDWPANITVFNGAKVQSKVFEELKTVVYGYSWDKVSIKEELSIKGFENLKEGYKNILLLHGDIAADSDYLPLDIKVLESLNMDYIALGHIHKPQKIRENIAYSGCPEPLDFGEVGARGFMKGEISAGRTSVEFVDFSKREYTIKEITINETMGYWDIIENIKEMDIKQRDKDFFRIILNGYRDKDINLNYLYNDLKDEFFHLELVDKTIPDYDLETMESDYQHNIVGKFIKTMKSKNLEDKNVKDALYYGLEALLKGKIDI